MSRSMNSAYCPVDILLHEFKTEESVLQVEDVKRTLYISLLSTQGDNHTDFTSIYSNKTDNGVFHKVVHCTSCEELQFALHESSERNITFDVITLDAHGSPRGLYMHQGFWRGSMKILSLANDFQGNEHIIAGLNTVLKKDGSLFLYSCETIKSGRCIARVLSESLERDVYAFDKSVLGGLRSFPKFDKSNIYIIENGKVIPNQLEFHYRRNYLSILSYAYLLVYVGASFFDEGYSKLFSFIKHSQNLTEDEYNEMLKVIIGVYFHFFSILAAVFMKEHMINKKVVPNGYAHNMSYFQLIITRILLLGSRLHGVALKKISHGEIK